jgi:hypothetical protein
MAVTARKKNGLSAGGWSGITHKADEPIVSLVRSRRIEAQIERPRGCDFAPFSNDHANS